MFSLTPKNLPTNNGRGYRDLSPAGVTELLIDEASNAKNVVTSTKVTNHLGGSNERSDIVTFHKRTSLL